MAERILVTDDDEDDFFILKQAFQVQQITEIEYANDCVQMFHYLKQQSDSKFPFPDLILLDINMPKIDGIRGLQLLKSSVQFQSIPVIMYSTSSDRNQKSQCFTLGANGFVTKANSYIELQSFTEKIKVYLQELRFQPGLNFTVNFPQFNHRS